MIKAKTIQTYEREPDLVFKAGVNLLNFWVIDINDIKEGDEVFLKFAYSFWNNKSEFSDAKMVGPKMYWKRVWEKGWKEWDSELGNVPNNVEERVAEFIVSHLVDRVLLNE